MNLFVAPVTQSNQILHIFLAPDFRIPDMMDFDIYGTSAMLTYISVFPQSSLPEFRPYASLQIVVFPDSRACIFAIRRSAALDIQMLVFWFVRLDFFSFNHAVSTSSNLPPPVLTASGSLLQMSIRLHRIRDFAVSEPVSLLRDASLTA